MAHTEKNDNHPMEETDDSAEKEHLKDFLQKGRWMSHVGRKIEYYSRAGGEFFFLKGRVIESDRKRGNY